MFRYKGTRTFLSNSTTGSPSLKYLPLKKPGFLLLLAVGIVYCTKDEPKQGEQIMFYIFIFIGASPCIGRAENLVEEG